MSVTDDDRQKALEIQWDWAKQTPGDNLPCLREEAEVLTELIAQALADAREEAEAPWKADLATLQDKRVEDGFIIRELNERLEFYGERVLQAEDRIADLERRCEGLVGELASTTQERDRLREFICHLNNRARHRWANAVDEATNALFKQMSASPILKAAKRPHSPTDATDRKPTL